VFIGEGTITEMSWDAVTIAWDNGQVAIVTTGTCEKLSDHRQGRRRCKGSGIRACSSRATCRPPLRRRQTPSMVCVTAVE
jgi:hypothetical protein